VEEGFGGAEVVGVEEDVKAVTSFFVRDEHGLDFEGASWSPD